MVGNDFVWMKIWVELSVLLNCILLFPSMYFSKENEEQKKAPKLLVFFHII